MPNSRSAPFVRAERITAVLEGFACDCNKHGIPVRRVTQMQ